MYSHDESANADDSVTEWVHRAQEGDADAMMLLYDRYVSQLEMVAKAKFGNDPRALADEEDIALSVFETLFRNFADGRFSDLQNRNELWYLLLSVTHKKVLTLKQHNNRLKRGGGKVFPISEMAGGSMMDKLEDHAPSAEMLAIMTDVYDVLLSCLPDPTFREIAQLKLQNETIKDIAKKLDLLPRIVERKLRLIRSLWIEEFAARGWYPELGEWPSDEAWGWTGQDQR